MTLRVDGPQTPGKPNYYCDRFAPGTGQTAEKRIRFASTDRRSVMNVSRPLTAHRPLIAIVMIHGNARHMHEGAIDAYQAGVDQLTRADYVVLRPLMLDGQPGTYGDTAHWRQRALETSELVDRVGEFAPDLSTARVVGAWGHSFGTDSVEECVGLDGDRDAALPVPINRKIDATALWSAMVDDSRMVIPRCFGYISVPMMSVTGLQDFAKDDPSDTSGDAYKWRLQPHKYAVQVERYALVHNFGHDQGGAVGTPGGLDDPATAALVGDALVAWFDWTLRAESLALKYLINYKSQFPDVVHDAEYLLPGVASTLV